MLGEETTVSLRSLTVVALANSKLLREKFLQLFKYLNVVRALDHSNILYCNGDVGIIISFMTV